MGSEKHETVLVRCVIWGQCTCWTQADKGKDEDPEMWGPGQTMGSSGHPSFPATPGPSAPEPVHTGSQYPEAYW